MTEAAAKMPEYKSHKIVSALKLEDIKYQPPGPLTPEAVILHPSDKAFAPITIEKGQGLTRFPSGGDADPGYLVVYADGYRSWSPTKAFEEGYTRLSETNVASDRPPHSMTFSEALVFLKSGSLLRRAGWNGPDQFIYLVDGSNFQVNRPPLLGIYAEGTEIDYLPHIDIKNQQGQCVPWLASQGDLLAEDWEILALDLPLRSV